MGYPQGEKDSACSMSASTRSASSREHPHPQALVSSRRYVVEVQQRLEDLELHLDLPSKPVEGKNAGGGNFLRQIAQKEREPGELQGAQVERPSRLAPLLAKPLPGRSGGRLALTDRHQAGSDAATLRGPKEHRKLGRLGLGQRLERCQQIPRLARLTRQREVRHHAH